MKPITKLILCSHCEDLGEPWKSRWACSFQSYINEDEPCSIQDYMICPLKGRDDKKSINGVQIDVSTNKDKTTKIVIDGKDYSKFITSGYVRHEMPGDLCRVQLEFIATLNERVL